MFRGMYGYGQGFMGNEAFGFPWLHLMFGLIFVALVVVGIILLIRMARSGKTGLSQGESLYSRALDILVERFARGEIDAETFRSMRAEIEKN
ncbi:MAG TPA: SHOCT domain-containing protein [Rectinemataceae bacterium]|nr:SHOCT domain-containing protein [Rectinemataceae bacterium]